MVLMDGYKNTCIYEKTASKITQTIDWLFLIDPTIIKIGMRIGRKFHIYK